MRSEAEVRLMREKFKRAITSIDAIEKRRCTLSQYYTLERLALIREKALMDWVLF